MATETKACENKTESNVDEAVDRNEKHVAMTTTIEVYRDKHQEWRWRAWRKGRIVAEGGEGYKRRATMMRSLQNFIASLQAFKYVIK